MSYKEDFPYSYILNVSFKTDKPVGLRFMRDKIIEAIKDGHWVVDPKVSLVAMDVDLDD